MANWKDKIVTAQEAVQAVKSGDRVLLHSAASEPAALTAALAERAPELSGVQVFQLFILGEAVFLRPGLEKSFRYVTTFVSPPSRAAVNSSLADYVPCLYSELPRLFASGAWPVDVALLQVSPPDAEGWCSFGLTADYAGIGAAKAGLVIAQMNSRLPWTNGEKVHVDRLDKIVLEDAPVFELPPPKVGEVERAIALNVAGLVPDGATLQLGIGAIPDTVLSFLKDKNDLGIHTEMFSDGVVELSRAGVINNRRKTLNPGKFIATFLMGTQKLYDFVDHNPAVELRPVDYTNDPWIIGQHDNLIAINSALQIDLTGQVNAECMGRTQYSGIGGQLDFVSGASRSKGGKSIFAFSSTAAGGKVSRICAGLYPGSGVTTPRGNVHYVVTEHGVADLRGKSIRERARELIAIAHPDFRDQLREEWAEESGVRL